MSNHYAHLDLAKGLMSDSKTFSPETVDTFFERLHQQAGRMGNIETVLLSAEPFYRGRMPDASSYWTGRRHYVSKLRALVRFENVEVVLVLRRQDEYLESLYNEHVKATRYTKDIFSFFADYRSRFEYGKQVRLWSEYFPNLKVYVFEDMVQSGNVVGAFLRVVLGLEGVQFDGMAKESNISLPVDLVEFKRLLNGTSLSRSGLRDVVSVLEKVANARADAGSSKMRRRLTQEDCSRLVAEFEDDNEWINDTFFGGRPAGLFPAEIKRRGVMTDLSPQDCVAIFSEMLAAKAIRLRD
jgi:hypothetical protein